MIEWVATSHFSFLESTADPGDLVNLAAELGYRGLAIADRMGMHGAVQGLRASDQWNAQHSNQHFFYTSGIRLHFDQADPVVIYPRHLQAHGRLCAFLSSWSLAGMCREGKEQEKGLSPLPWSLFLDFLSKSRVEADYVLISVSGRFFPWNPQHTQHTRHRTQDDQAIGPSFSKAPTIPGRLPFWLLELRELCGQGPNSALSLAYPITQAPGIEDLHSWIQQSSKELSIPVVATTLPVLKTSSDQALGDVLLSMRFQKPISELGWLKHPNGNRRLLSPHERLHTQKQLKNIFPNQCPIQRSLDLEHRITFSLHELRYQYPKEALPSGHTSHSWLSKLTWEGATQRYGNNIPSKVSAQIEKELSLIRELKVEDYFLTIWDVLRYAREQHILFQGRGSAANSAVCYCLGITAVDPVRSNLLFERFLSVERGEPPDIDVDFEHERREEVLQEVYRRYGRTRAAMVATVITFRDRMAVRETAKALDFPKACIDLLIRFMGREGFKRLQLEPTGILKNILSQHQITRKKWLLLLSLAQQLKGKPRHLGIHTGGFILTDRSLNELCVLEGARMKNRSVIPWDKNDVEYLGWMKVDLLSLGMLSAIRKCFDLIGSNNITNKKLHLSSVPSECPKVYKALQKADTVGVFQIESRAQMNMLPRLCPKTFYDLVVEVAIVRPGPLQGGMVHPYLKRRQGLEAITYDHPSLEPILKKTLGVPIFQEQVMKMAVAVAGFTPGEADQLRKVMSGAWRQKSQMPRIKEKLVQGLLQNGITGAFAERVYKQIEGFGEYGFPESHAASFAILTYVSSWLKVHHPAAFACALLNSQPMGFYSNRSLILDAEQHGVTALPINVYRSQWDCHLIPTKQQNNPLLSLGFRLIRGFPKADAERIQALQRHGDSFSNIQKDSKCPDFLSPQKLSEHGISSKGIELLIRANAFGSSSGDPRRNNLWLWAKEKTITGQQRHLNWESASTTPSQIPKLSAWESLLLDYNTTGFSVQKNHPSTHARRMFGSHPWITAESIYNVQAHPYGSIVHVIGLLAIKQKPPTAGGLVFVTLEDETGFFNLTLHPPVYEACRFVLDTSSLLAATGRIERSRPTIPNEPKTSATSIVVEHLWNPLEAEPKNSPKGVSPRNYH